MWSHAPRSILPLLLHGIDYPLNKETTLFISLRDPETLHGDKTPELQDYLGTYNHQYRKFLDSYEEYQGTIKPEENPVPLTSWVSEDLSDDPQLSEYQKGAPNEVQSFQRAFVQDFVRAGNWVCLSLLQKHPPPTQLLVFLASVSRTSQHDRRGR